MWKPFILCLVYRDVAQDSKNAKIMQFTEQDKQ